jgi:GntR family transcriptional regulator
MSEGAEPAWAIDLHKDGTPIYVQLAGLFRRRIVNGEWPVGHHIPTLDSLALEFGVARATVRQTTGILMQEGLLVRRRGRGTIVIHRPQPEFWYEVGADWDEVIQAYRREGFSTQILDSKDGVALPQEHAHHGKGIADYYYIRRLNRIGTQPVAVDAVWLDSEVARRIGPAKIRGLPTLLPLHEMPGINIDRALQTLTIAAADIELSTLLGLSLNAPLAVIHRALYGANDRLLCVYQSFNRGDTFRLKMRLR